jgi:hypothetical protein
VEPEDYPFGEGQWWADPSIDELAGKMQAIRKLRLAGNTLEKQRLMRRRSEIAVAYSPSKTGRDIGRRLRQIARRLMSDRRGHG